MVAMRAAFMTVIVVMSMSMHAERCLRLVFCVAMHTQRRRPGELERDDQHEDDGD